MAPKGLKMYNFYSNCVSWPEDAFLDGGLSDMIDNAIDISRKTFLNHVDNSELSDIAEGFGYAKHPSQGLTMAGDWHISYHRSKLHGKRVYYFRYSAIEYVFTKN